MTDTQRNTRSQRGFTLAEILVTTAIFAIIMIAALAVYDKSNRVFKSSTEAADMQQSTRIAFDKLVSDIRMAGFDYNRGGTPGLGANPAWTASTLYPVGAKVDVGNGFVYTAVTAGTSGAAQPVWDTSIGGSTTDGSVRWRTDSNGTQYAQPDEQIEYAGQNVIAFRANFDYYSDTANGNGLEPSYTPKDASTGVAIFPYVTTGNDEIIIYAMRSADSTKNTSSISFFADTDKPRSAYPPSGVEKQVKVTGIDTTMDNPPYQLVRMSVADAVSGVIDAKDATPVSENLRSLQFYYYTDNGGSKVLPDAANAQFNSGHNADSSTFTALDKAGANTGAIGGDGKWDGTNIGGTTNYGDRDQRALISTVRVTVIGMNAQPEPGYTNATETVSTIKNYKQYTLTTLIAPRNLGLTGSAEPSYIPPGQPTITGVCTGHCNAPVVFWSAPAGGGPVFSYRVESDTALAGAYANSVSIYDPTATYTIMPDDGTDPSVVHYYRVVALNDNGAGPPSDSVAATPKNSTKPNAPTALTATNNQTNQITLTWVGPTDNATGKNTLSCSGGQSSSGSSIPGQETLAYRIWRSTSSSFDPDAGQGVLVLDYNDQSQPQGAPGASMTWVDTGAVPSGKTKPSSRSAPAACVQYYYRIRAVDRCIANNSYNASNDLRDSQSAFQPGTGNSGAAGISTSSSTPNAPAGLNVNTATSACPAVAGASNCIVALQWAKVTTDTAGSAIGVDTYRITRSRKKLGDPTYGSDPTFTPLDVSNFTDNSNGTATWNDTTPPFKDTGDGQPWYYQYTVAAKGCSGYSAESNTTHYPVTCAINPAIVSPNANNPTATGDSPSDAWIFDVNDNINVTAAAGGPAIAKVIFDIRLYPSGTGFTSFTVNSGPTFTMGWPPGATDLQLYEVDIYVTNAAGCTETHIKYVQDNKPAVCALQITNTPTVSEATAGSVATASISYTLQNTGAEALVLNKVTSPTVAGLVDVTWHDPDSAHSDMIFKTLDYGTTSDNFLSPASGTVGTSTIALTRNIPSSITSLAGSSSMTLTLRFTYAKKLSTLALAPDTKLCITYGLASEAYALKHCNIVGQAGTTNNPNSCD